MIVHNAIAQMDGRHPHLITIRQISRCSERMRCSPVWLVMPTDMPGHLRTVILVISKIMTILQIQTIRRLDSLLIAKLATIPSPGTRPPGTMTRNTSRYIRAGIKEYGIPVLTVIKIQAIIVNIPVMSFVIQVIIIKMKIAIHVTGTEMDNNLVKG